MNGMVRHRRLSANGLKTRAFRADVVDAQGSRELTGGEGGYPIFNTLDSLIENDGVYLYLVFVWLALLAIGWIFSGGLRKRMKGNSVTVISGIIFTMQPPM